MNKDGSKSQRPRSPRCALGSVVHSRYNDNDITTAIIDAREEQGALMFRKSDLDDAVRNGLLTRALAADIVVLHRLIY